MVQLFGHSGAAPEIVEGRVDREADTGLLHEPEVRAFAVVDVGEGSGGDVVEGGLDGFGPLLLALSAVAVGDHADGLWCGVFVAGDDALGAVLGCSGVHEKADPHHHSRFRLVEACKEGGDLTDGDNVFAFVHHFEAEELPHAGEELAVEVAVQRGEELPFVADAELAGEGDGGGGRVAAVEHLEDDVGGDAAVATDADVLAGELRAGPAEDLTTTPAVVPSREQPKLLPAFSLAARCRRIRSPPRRTTLNLPIPLVNRRSSDGSHIRHHRCGRLRGRRSDTNGSSSGTRRTRGHAFDGHCQKKGECVCG